jgi:hypothetical protein
MIPCGRVLLRSRRDATRATVQMLAPRRRNHPGVSRRRLAAERQMPIGALSHAANASIEDVLAEGSTRTMIRTVRERIVRVARYCFPL